MLVPSGSPAPAGTSGPGDATAPTGGRGPAPTPGAQPWAGGDGRGAPAGGVPPTARTGLSHRQLVVETWVVMAAFLVAPLTSAVVIFVQHVQSSAGITRFPTYVSHQPIVNMVLGILAYSPILAVVPIALLLLARTGQPPAELGLRHPGLRRDVLPGLGLAALAFVGEIVVAIPLAPLLTNRSAVNNVTVGHVPAYYVIWGLAASAMTAVAEECLMNGYFMTRLQQLGWAPDRALMLSLALRTSYHVYYGIGFLLTVPFGFLVTRSFQKHRRLARVIAAHFLFDGILFTIAILVR